MRQLILILFSFFVINATFAFNDSLSIECIIKNNINYQKFILEGDKLFAINDSGNLIIWNINTFDTILFNNNYSSENFQCITKDNKNQIYLGTHKGKIYKLNPLNYQFNLVAQSKYYPIKAISINAQNEIIVSVPYFLYNPIKKKLYQKFYNHPYKEKSYRIYFGGIKLPIKGLLDITDYEYLDKKGNWWLCSLHGEWGSDIQIFNINEKRVLNNNIDNFEPKSSNITSIFEDNIGNLYITKGFDAYGFGGIFQISKNGKGANIFDGIEPEINPDTIQLKIIETKDGVIKVAAKQNIIFSINKYIGAGNFNKNDTSIYFSTNFGVYKTNIPQNEKIEDFEQVIIPKNSEQEKFLSDSNFSQIEFGNDNTLFILSKSKGIFVYKDNRLIILK